MQSARSKFYRFLRWTERYTRTDMVYFTSGGFWLVLGIIVTTGLSFVSAVIFANFLPKEIYGTYSFILAIAGILAIATLPGMNTAVTRSVARGYDGTPLNALRTQLTWGSAATIVSLFISLYYFLNKNNDLATIFLLIAPLIPVAESFSLYSSILIGKRAFDTKTIFSFCAKFTNSVTVALAVLFSNNVLIIVTTYFLSWSITRLFFFHITNKRFLINNKVDPSAISFGKHLSVINLLEKIAFYIDRILIFHYYGAVQAAIYSFALAPVDMLGSVMNPIRTLALPKFSKKEDGVVIRGLFSKIWRLSLVTTTLALLYIGIAPFLFKIAFPQYLDSVIFSQVLALSIIGAGGLPKVYFDSQRKIKSNYILSLFSSISKIVLVGALTVTMGLWGTVLATLISRLASFLVSMVLITHSK